MEHAISSFQPHTHIPANNTTLLCISSCTSFQGNFFCIYSKQIQMKFLKYWDNMVDYNVCNFHLNRFYRLSAINVWSHQGCFCLISSLGFQCAITCKHLWFFQALILIRFIAFLQLHKHYKMRVKSNDFFIGWLNTVHCNDPGLEIDKSWAQNRYIDS